MIALPRETFVAVMRLTLDKRYRAALKQSIRKDGDALAGGLEWVMSVEEANLVETSNYSETMGKW